MQQEQQQHEAETTDVSGEPKKRPVAKFEATGHLSVAVWKNPSSEGQDYFSVSIEKNYRQNDGSYQKTGSLEERDLLKLSRLLQLADDWIEQEKGRMRTGVSHADRVR